MSHGRNTAFRPVLTELFHIPLTAYNRQGNWPSPFPAAVALGKASPATRLSRTVELTQLAEAWVGWSWWWESRKADHTPLVCHVVLRMKERCSCPHHLWWVREPNLPLLPACRTLGSGHSTSPGWHSRTEKSAGEPGWDGKCGLTPQLLYGYVGREEMLSPPPHS